MRTIILTLLLACAHRPAMAQQSGLFQTEAGWRAGFQWEDQLELFADSLAAEAFVDSFCAVGGWRVATCELDMDGSRVQLATSKKRDAALRGMLLDGLWYNVARAGQLNHPRLAGQTCVVEQDGQWFSAWREGDALTLFGDADQARAFFQARRDSGQRSSKIDGEQWQVVAGASGQGAREACLEAALYNLEMAALRHP